MNLRYLSLKWIWMNSVYTGHGTSLQLEWQGHGHPNPSSKDSLEFKPMPAFRRRAFLIWYVSGTRPSADKEPTSARTGDGAAKGTLGTSASKDVNICQQCAERLRVVRHSTTFVSWFVLSYVAGDFPTMPLPSHGRPMRRARKFASNPPGDLRSPCWPFKTLSSGWNMLKLPGFDPMMVSLVTWSAAALSASVGSWSHASPQPWPKLWDWLKLCSYDLCQSIVMFAFTNSWRCLHLEFQSLKTDSSCQNVQRYEATAPDHTSCSTGAAGTLLSQHCGEPCIWKRMCKVKQSNMAMRSSYSRCSSLSSRRVMAAECWGYHWNSSVLGHKVKFTHLRYSLSIKICPFLPIGPIRPLLQSSMIIEFHEVLGFWDFYGILGFKVKMHHFERPASRRVVRKSVECCGFCWIRGPQVQLAFQRNWNSRKQSETVGNSRKQSETVGNSRKQSETVGSGPAWSCQNCQSAIFLQKKKRSAQSPFFLKVQRETVGNSWGSYLWLGKKRAI